ncbi:MAG: hypothetical protein LBI06_07305, partial [Treponema sp.]|nr:hypothetical protein [Treponema sp.]
MAKLIEEPRDDMADLDDWKKFLYRTTRQGGGFICIGLTNMDSGARPQIAAGSRLEINGAVYENKESFYEAAENEDIAGEPYDSGRQYVYAVPSSEAGETCSFKFSQDTPEWSAAKGGWYKGNDRAVAKLDYFSDGNQYNYKVIL